MSSIAVRFAEPRLTPLSDAELSEEQAEVLGRFRGPAGVFNIFRTLVRAPKALRRFGYWGAYVLSDDNSLPARSRELVILRVGYLCRSGYEWAQHVVIGRSAGLTDDDIERIKAGPDHEAWSVSDRTVLRAVDELVGDHCVADPTWKELVTIAGLSDRQRMDLVFTTGQYTQVAMMLNTFGVPLDDGLTPDPDLADG